MTLLPFHHHAPPLGPRPPQQAAGWLSEQAASHLSTLVVQAFLASLPEDGPGWPLLAGPEAPAVRVTAVAGLPSEGSFAMPGA